MSGGGPGMHLWDGEIGGGHGGALHVQRLVPGDTGPEGGAGGLLIRQREAHNGAARLDSHLPQVQRRVQNRVRCDYQNVVGLGPRPILLPAQPQPPSCLQLLALLATAPTTMVLWHGGHVL